MYPWPETDFPVFLGGIAATEGIAFCFTYPFWHYKVLCQLPGGNLNWFTKGGNPVSKIPSLYRGCSTAVIGLFPGNAAYLTTYECARHYSGLTGMSADFVGGFLAEVSYLALALPVENVVVRMMSDEKKRRWNLILREVNKDRSWYRGLRATVMTALPASCLWWPVYEQCKSFIAPHTPYYVAAGTSSLTASFLTTVMLHPIDTAKARMQSGKGTYGEKDGSVFRLLRQVTRNEGYRAAFRGLVPRLLLSQCEGLLWGASYELIISYSRKSKE